MDYTILFYNLTLYNKRNQHHYLILTM